METTSEADGSRSPKRQALAAGAVTTLDAAIWTNIVEFLPMPKDLNPDDLSNYDATVSEIVATWKTLLNLRLVSKELSALLHPVDNKALWRRLVLQNFDFSVSDGYGYNVESHHDGTGEHEEPIDADPEDPQIEALRGRRHEVPVEFLAEDLIEWSKLGIYHRPSQYGFLTTLQQQPPVGVWPESEDTFSLFGDLVRLLMLPHGAEMENGGEGCETGVKYIAASAEAGSDSPFYSSYVMKTLGYGPHFWGWGRGIGKEWKGFTEQVDWKAYVDESVIDEDGEYSDGEAFEDHDDDLDFPNSNVGSAKRLNQHIRLHCQDYRAVCCNGGSDGLTPVFFVGQSKAPPHRWTGYAGEKCWS